jgi:hypothetical protein
MQTYQVETIISEEGILTIKGLPLHKGEKVEVIVKSSSVGNDQKNPYPLRGKPVSYKNPFESVAENEWNVI